MVARDFGPGWIAARLTHTGATMRQQEGHLEEVAAGIYAWLQGDGSWGWSNAGLISDGQRSLLVDTLYDVPLTERMLRTMRDATPAARGIEAVVNTHANGDHCYGNQVLKGTPIIASKAAAEEMAEFPPAKMAAFLKAGRLAMKLPPPLSWIPLGKGMPRLPALGRYLNACFGAFDYQNTALVLPSQTFSGSLKHSVGQIEVELLEVGPAHTRGDVLAWVPSARVVFTGDILFHLGHPIIWAGPIHNWIRACERIIALEPEVVVPGHGPLATVDAVTKLKAYLEYVRAQARTRYDAGMGVLEAARDISLSDYSSWGDAERIVVNVDTLYREFSGKTRPTSPIKLFAMMTALWQDRRA